MFHVAGKRIPIGHKILQNDTDIVSESEECVLEPKTYPNTPYNHDLGTYAFVGICQPTLR